MTADEWHRSADPLALVQHLRSRRPVPARLFGWAFGPAAPLPPPKLRQLFDAVIDLPPDWAEPDQLTFRTRLSASVEQVEGCDRQVAELLAAASGPVRLLFRTANALPDGFSLDQVVTALLAGDRDNPPLADAVRCLFGNPFHPVGDAKPWRTGAAVLLAQAVDADGDWSRLPVLADALEDGGCEHAGLLNHLRSGGPHRPGCHALDVVLGR